MYASCHFRASPPKQVSQKGVRWANGKYATVKYALTASILLCMVAVLGSGRRRDYRLTLLYLASCIPATLAFRAESAWLHAWYPVIASPVALLRLASGLEVLHRQTDGFRYWWRLMGSVFMLAGMFCGLAWVQSANPDALRSVVELRRLLQIFLAGCFLVVELFWLTQGGGWYRKADWVAAVFGVLALNHAVTSILAEIGRYGELQSWLDASGAAWLIDGFCYLGLTLLFSDALQSSGISRRFRRSRRAALHSHVSNL